MQDDHNLSEFHRELMLILAVTNNPNCDGDHRIDDGDPNRIRQIFMKLYPDELNRRLLYKNSISHGMTNIVKYLIQNEYVSMDTVKHYDSSYFLPTDRCMYANSFMMACKLGHYQIVKFLLKYPEIDPSDAADFALQLACKYGHLKVVKLLLSDSRVDPSSYKNLAFEWAAEFGNIETLKYLLTRSKYAGYIAIRKAAKNNHIEISELLKAYIVDQQN